MGEFIPSLKPQFIQFCPFRTICSLCWTHE